MNKKLFRPKLGREWTVTWSEKEKKEFVKCFIQEHKDKKYYDELFKGRTMSVATFLRRGHKINKN